MKQNCARIVFIFLPHLYSPTFSHEDTSTKHSGGRVNGEAHISALLFILLFRTDAHIETQRQITRHALTLAFIC